MTHSAVEDDFQTLTGQYRRELLAYCYRMLGSVHDAEDLVQETYLRAWKSYENFEGRSSLRTWLYRIATNACLTALEGRGRRPLPTGLGAPSADPGAELVERPEVPWLEPVPDAVVGAGGAMAGDPAAIVTSRASIRLALITALQYLPTRQRVVLIMRDVLGWRAAEVAELLGSTTVAVNSMLQRARSQISELAPPEDEVTEPATAQQRELLERYVAAFEQYDTAALVKLFSSDVVWEMPPFTGWYQTPEVIGRLVASQCPAKQAGDLRLVATEANGQAAFGMYLRDESGGYQPFQLHVLHLAGGGEADERSGADEASGVAIDHVTAFFDLSLFPMFGLPGSIAAGS
ncbi:MAG: sigma-70 family RNA polymerase sigma factor [Streptosporangiaceae bacterium]